jgi:hypothetical protein
VSGGAERRRRDETVYVPCFWLPETIHTRCWGNTGYGDRGKKYREYRVLGDF